MKNVRTVYFEIKANGTTLYITWKKVSASGGMYKDEIYVDTITNNIYPLLSDFLKAEIEEKGRKLWTEYRPPKEQGLS